MNINRPFICSLVLFFCLAQGSFAQSDSIWHVVQKLHLSKSDSAIGICYQQLRQTSKNDFSNLSQAHYWIGNTYMKLNLDSAQKHANLALDLANRSDDPILRAKSHHLLGSIDNRLSKFDSAIEHFKQGLEELHSEKDTTSGRYMQIYEILLRGTSTTYNYMNRNDEAMTYGLKALNYAQRYDLDFPQQAGLIAISSLFYKVKNYEEAKKYMHLALKKCKDANNELGAAKCYNNLAIYHSAELQYDSAVWYQSKGINMYRVMGNTEGLANSLVLLAMIQFELGKEEEAIGHLLEAEKIVKEKSFDIQLFDVLVDLAMAYNKLGNFKEGLAKADELIAFASSKNRPDKIVRGYTMKYESLYGLGNYKESVEYLQKSMALSDSIKATENDKNLQQLLVKYESEKKEEEIKRITSEAEVKDLLIRQRNIQLLSGGAGVLALITLAFLMFRSYRIRNEFELLDLKQRFYRAQINPHFLFNALGSVQGFFYDKTDPNKAAGYLSRLSKLMRQILENTFDNEVTLAEEATLMENYLEVQKVRMSDRFDYTIDMDEDLEDVIIPSMITQPFLENAVEHGFKELTDRKGMIHISVIEMSGAIQIKIEDNGTGLAQSSAPSDHRSRAMEITRERLQLLEKVKGKKASFEVKDNRVNGGVGVTVLINLPT